MTSRFSLGPFGLPRIRGRAQETSRHPGRVSPTGQLLTGPTQQARNLAVGERLRGVRVLIRDRDSKYSGPFDEVSRTEGVKVVKTPIRAPKANAFAERWVRTVRTECLDWMLALGRRHLERILGIYTAR